MEVAQDLGNDNGVVAEQVMESPGEPQEVETGIEESSGAPGNQAASRDTISVQKRLKAQKRAHERQMYEMQARINQLESQLQPDVQPNQYEAGAGSAGGVQDAIQQAVSYALQQKQREEQRAREAEAQQHIAKQYAELSRHLDSVGDKYDDFEDVVRGDVPFTAHMRDAALMLPRKGPGSAGEVLYQLGKNPDELSRIAKLHPVDQAAELVALSHALIQGGESRREQPSRPLGQIRTNPVVNAGGVTDKMPVSEIRNRMKKGSFR